MSGSRKYPPELRERAVRMVAEIRDEHESHWAAMKQVVDLLGVGSAETVRQWVRQAEVDTGARPGTTNDETAELKRLRRENAELKRTTSTLKAASAFFAAEIDRRAADPGSSSPNTRATETQVTCGGHESICATLTKLGVPVAPLTHYAHRTRVPPAVSSDGTLHSRSRSSVLQVNREGIPFARCTVERLMRRLRLAGVSRGKTKRTTVPDPSASWLADLVRRGFAPLTPNRLWAADITYVSPWSGWVYVASIVDGYARRILGWRTATTMNTSLVLDAIEHAIWTRQHDRSNVKSVVHHTVRGSRYTSIAFTERLADAGIQPSVGAVGSSYNNAVGAHHRRNPATRRCRILPTLLSTLIATNSRSSPKSNHHAGRYRTHPG